MLEEDHQRVTDKLLEGAEAYARHAFGARLDLQAIAPTRLPHFLLDRYRLWQGVLLGQSAIFMAPKLHILQQGAAADLIKHRELIRRELGVPLVLVLLDSAPITIRKQMIERQIGFLVPGTQLYVPEALLDLRERGGRGQVAVGDQMSPTAQMLVLASLLGEPIGDANLTILADRFHVAIMSISRALDELEALAVAKARHVGRQRRLNFILKGHELWLAVETRLQSPVRTVRTVRGLIPDYVAPFAGESALAHYTMLSPPRIERRALPAARWKALQETLVLEPATAFDDDRIEVETWTYAPRVLSRGEYVDPLSLHLSVRHDRDERVVQAAEQLLESFAW